MTGDQVEEYSATEQVDCSVLGETHGTQHIAHYILRECSSLARHWGDNGLLVGLNWVFPDYLNL